VCNFLSLGLPLSKYLAILAKSLPNEIPAKFHLLRKFLQNSIRSGHGLNSKLAGNPGHVFGAQLNGTIQTQSRNPTW
jgi:hypothetical protein